MSIPMLADFALRLAGGLAAMLLVTSWRSVPLLFFRTHCQVILGLLVLAGLDLSRATPDRAGLGVVIGLAVLAYFASVAWGLGIPRVAVPLSVLIAAGSVGLMVFASQSGMPSVWGLNAAGRVASAFLMGSTLTAMLLGHYYLTAPAMSIDPLKRFVLCMGGALVIRGLLGAIGVWEWWNGYAASHSVSALWLASRWGVGFAGPVVATSLAWRTVQMRSTQSATGILYTAMIMVLFGELTALILSRGTDVIF